MGLNSIVSLTSLVCVSMSDTEPDSSLVTQSVLPSSDRAKRRGRLPTTIFASISWLSRLTTCTMFATSDVT